MEYVANKESVQMITRIFIDDFEIALKEEYDESLVLMENPEPKIYEEYMAGYLQKNFKVKINGKEIPIKFIGKEYDADVVKCYLEIEKVNSINSFEIRNSVLFNRFPDQQNIIKTNINSKQKSAILTSKDNKLLLNFN